MVKHLRAEIVYYSPFSDGIKHAHFKSWEWITDTDVDSINV